MLLLADRTWLRLLMLHLIKIASAPDSHAVLHWHDEARNFRADALTRFAPSMADRLNLARAWRLAGEQADSSLPKHGETVMPLPSRCPWTVEELISEPMDLDSLLSKSQDAATACHEAS